jgi:hypothetical protein
VLLLLLLLLLLMMMMMMTVLLLLLLMMMMMTPLLLSFQLQEWCCCCRLYSCCWLTTLQLPAGPHPRAAAAGVLAGGGHQGSATPVQSAPLVAADAGGVHLPQPTAGSSWGLGRKNNHASPQLRVPAVQQKQAHCSFLFPAVPWLNPKRSVLCHWGLAMLPRS